MQNCKASDWSDCVVLVGHMITCLFSLTLIGLEWSYDQNKVPLQFSTELSSSGGIIILIKIGVKVDERDLSALYYVIMAAQWGVFSAPDLVMPRVYRSV